MIGVALTKSHAAAAVLSLSPPLGGGGALPTSEVSTEPSESDFFGSTRLAHRLEKKQQID
jgi:hypothetical protein